MAKAKNDQNLVDHVVTEEDLKKNPELVKEDVKIGDTIQVPAEPTEEEINAVIAEIEKAETVEELDQFKQESPEIEAAVEKRIAELAEAEAEKAAEAAKKESSAGKKGTFTCRVKHNGTQYEIGDTPSKEDAKDCKKFLN